MRYSVICFQCKLSHMLKNKQILYLSLILLKLVKVAAGNLRSKDVHVVLLKVFPDLLTTNMNVFIRKYIYLLALRHLAK